MEFHRFARIMYGGLRFDLSAILYLNALYVGLYLLPLPFRENRIYQAILKYLFFIINGIALAANVCDYFYFDFILKRSGMDVMMFAEEGNILSLIKLFLIDYWMGPLIWLAQFAILIFGYNRLHFARRSNPKRWAFYLSALAWFMVSMYFSVIGMRSGFTRTTRPITIGNAGAYTEKPLEMSIVLNTPFTLIKTYNKVELTEKKYFSDEELKTIYQPIHPGDTTKMFKPLNVVVFVMESFSREFIGSLNQNLEAGKYGGFTPFIDSLILQSKTFRNSFANGIKSIDALPSVVSGIPSFFQSYVKSPYATNDVISLGKILREKGYETAFFHGAPNGSMGFDAFMKVAGYNRYFGMKEYGNDADFDGAWGIWDEEFMLYMEKEFGKLKEPFNAVFFSVSSHHPFKIPEKYAGKFKEGPSKFAIPIQYTDMALSRFFAEASKKPWFNNTLFVITSDHSAIPIHPEFKNSVGMFAAPVIFYRPSDPDLRGMDSTVVQQIDILPSVLGYLGYDKDFVSFGNNVFDTSARHFAVNFNNEYYQIIKGRYVLQFINNKAKAIYNYVEDPLLTKNLIDSIPETQQDLERLLKAFIQEFNKRMIKNKLTTEE
jgi:phosphoglycerol transferase MdoB-like AlkP superfamily enzyme